MKLGYQLVIEQTQSLTMTPELIQAIKILQFNFQDLQEFVENEMLENPVLETASDFTKQMDVLREHMVSDRGYERSFKNWENDPDNDEDFSFEKYISREMTLHDFLLEQLTFSDMDDSLIPVGEHIIHGIDNNGYLRLTTDEIAEEFKIDEDEVEEAISVIQNFDPPGVAARSLRECLLIQLRHKDKLTPILEILISNYLEELADNKISLIAKQLSVRPEEVQAMADAIRELEPKPGSVYFSGEDIKYVVPDVTLENVCGQWVLTSNDNSMPRLMVSSYYKKLAKESTDDENLDKYLNERLNSALWLIKNIEQRKQTIYNVASAIVKEQQEFFQRGKKFLKPMSLKDIADALGIHESTVSRAINGKYMLSPRGLFELKYFFSSGVSDGGEGLSSNSIKSYISDYVQEEDPKKPLSDQKIAERLKEQGIEISRRTVAKYRESLGILSSSKRRRF